MMLLRRMPPLKRWTQVGIISNLCKLNLRRRKIDKSRKLCSRLIGTTPGPWQGQNQSYFAMKLIYWNIRGLANSPSRQACRNFCNSHKPDFLFLTEPWINFDQVPISFWKSLKLKPFIFNDRGSQIPNLWGLCADHLNVDVLSQSRQHLSFSLTLNQHRIFIAAIYAATDYTIRRDLWNELQVLIQNNQGPWLCIRDFNSILGSQEQRGEGSVSSIACSKFRSWSDSCSLSHLPTLGSEFTWTNNRSGSSLTERKLDR